MAISSLANNYIVVRHEHPLAPTAGRTLQTIASSPIHDLYEELSAKHIITDRRKIATRPKGRSIQRIAESSVRDKVEILTLDDDHRDDADEIAKIMCTMPGVEYAEVPAIRVPQASRAGQVDPDGDGSSYSALDSGWALKLIQYWEALEQIDDILEQSENLSVAVIDTGVDTSHPLLDPVRIVSHDLINAGSGVDPVGHGTGVCGIIAGKRDPRSEFLGMCRPTMHVYSAIPAKDVKEYDPYSYYQAISDATDARADVINLSLGGDFDSLEKEMLEEAVRNGSSVVAAAGNWGDKGNPPNPPIFPAFLPFVISVGSVGPSKQWSEFSTWNEQVDLVAPGEQVTTLTTPIEDGEETAIVSGTSFAAPHVSGGLILLKAARLGTTPAELRSILCNGCRYCRVQSDKDSRHGHGVLNLFGSIERAKNDHETK